MKVLVEKYKKWNHINVYGYFVWTNKYGDITRIEDENGKLKNIHGISVENFEDLKAYHGIDIVSQLTSMLGETIALEIDREIMNELRKAINEEDIQ